MANPGLIKQSQSLVRNANTILRETGILELLGALGRVEIIGSLRLEAMYRRDIDLFVISETISKPKAQEVTKNLLDTAAFQTVSLADYQTFPAFDMPLGYYWELIIPYENENWKFDIWYLQPNERYTHLVSDAIKRFEGALASASGKLETILAIKEAYFDGVKYKNQVISFDIYTAVLDCGITSPKEFSEWYTSRGSTS